MIRAALLLLALTAAAPVRSTPVRVVIKVDGLSANRGQVLLGLCTKDQFLSPKCAYQSVLPVGAARTVQAVAMVPPGQYAVQAVYDLNSNFKLDTNMIGIPLEPVGFSRNATGRQSAPRFADAALIIKRPSALTVSVR